MRCTFLLEGSVTSKASGQLAVRLNLVVRRLEGSRSVMVLCVDPSEICRDCNARRSLLPLYTGTKEPASIALMISVQAMLWRSVIIPEKVWS